MAPGVARLTKVLCRYLISCAALVVAAALTLLILHFKLPRPLVNYGFLTVIIGSAWWGGYGPGIFTALTTVFFGPYLVLPHYSVRNVNQHGALWGVPEILVLSIVISWMAAARRKLGEANELLDERVRERTAELERANLALQEREALLLRQAEELSQSNSDLEQFAYVASHDLQEPLRMIAIYTELLQKRSAARFDERSTEFMDTVLDGVRRMERLIADLLTYSRAIHAEAREPAEVDSAEALRIAMLNLEPTIQAAGARIDHDPLPRLACHNGELTQVFQNLISNAIKYRGPEAPSIRISVARQGDDWVFSVHDNGMGIHADYHETIFRPFKRLHGQQYPGSGVGLAICKRIVERSGGRIWVESQPEQGATFHFTLPDAVAARKSLVSAAT